MAARNKPYDQFGPYILFKKLEADALGDSWRAGRIDGTTLGPTVALRRFTGGQRDALVANAQAVEPILPRINGTSFARDQQAGVLDGIPFIAFEYAGGRSLRHIIDRARGSKEVQPNPLPLDQAIVIAEKVALSLATMADLRDSAGTRLSHGALIPQFIWISDDGEIRVAGQQFGAGLIASLGDPKVGADIGRYFSPEYRGGQAQKNTDVYSMGAILFLLVTGQEPPDAATASAFAAATRAARTMTGQPIPDDIRVILDKSFNLDPSMRFASIGDMKQAITGLANSGKYSATTFNLAFYLSSLLKKEMETEAADREKEAKVNLAPYVEAPRLTPAPAPAAAAPAQPVQEHAFSFGQQADAEPKKSKAPLAIAAAALIAIVGGGAWMMLGKSRTQAEPAVATAQTIPAAPKPVQQLIPEPIAVTPDGTVTAGATTTAATDAELQKKAFEDAVKAKLQAEMMKLQDDFTANLKKQQSKNAPVATAPPPVETAAVPAPADERPAISAAQLDQQRREAQAAESRPAVPAPVQTTQTTAPQPAVSAPAPAPVNVVREGDVIAVGELDVLPRITRAVKPVYPAMAIRQKIAATILLTVLVSETGEVLDVRVLRGEPRFGFNDAAVRAMKATRFSSPMKDGKRVRTWLPQSYDFKAN